MTDRRGSERRDIQNEVRDALHDLLHNAITYDGADVPHYKDGGSDPTFPHLETVTTSMTPAAVQTSTAYGGAQTVEAQVSVWTTQRNDTEVKAIKDELATVIHGQSLPVPSELKVVRKRIMAGGEILKDPSPQVTFQGITTVQYRIQLPTL